MLAALAAATSPGRAQTPEELREQRDQAKEDAAAAYATINAHTAEITELEAAIAALQADRDAKAEQQAAAGRALSAAEEAGAEAEVAIDELEKERLLMVNQLQAAAVTAYVEFQGGSGSQDFIEDPWGSTWLETLAEFGTGSGSEELDRFRAIEAELDAQRAIAEESAAEAKQLEAKLQAEGAELDQAIHDLQHLVDDVDARIDDLLVEADALETLAAGLETEAARQEAAEIAAAKRAEEARLIDAVAGEPAGGSGDSSGSDNGNGDSGDGSDDYSIPKPDTKWIGSIEVAASIEDDAKGLLDAMADEGYPLSGGGYRSHERQIQLRMSNCGTSHAAIWEWPARRCRPPTARPGRSNHEKGLAIDFTYQGRILRSRNTDVYRALARLAPIYNFRNLPSEAWHWDHTSAR